MPAILTHYLFGEATLPCVREQVGFGVPRDAAGASAPGSSAPGAGANPQARRDLDCTLAFLVGSQGPDPLFFPIASVRAPIACRCGVVWHRGHMSATLARLRADASALPADDRPIGRAFAAGQLAHYLLDRTAHPFVYAQQRALCASSADLRNATHEVHYVIESDIDAAMLRLARGLTVRQFPPRCAIPTTARVDRVAGSLVASCARHVLGRPLAPGDYGRALKTMRAAYRAIEPTSSNAAYVLTSVERVVRPHSALSALAHRVDLDESCPSMNPSGLGWTSPFTGDTSHERFIDLFARAMRTFEECLPAYLGGCDTAEITHHVDYSGRPLAADEAPAKER